ncbi:carboxypeptidase-like regulatory domain-containing protein [Pontibacter diazotrophicus]|uniref:Carboxypeptidase-like regulatory domain-containing protein n=1 Tax=Pontibacter diazotrophicus TaxID=1400979 RepID=A0A3D8LDS3_9BACT|nr:carboxypeptidase-like regulatory domain-containing protein [Pontibacter diazotrophicus]RDV15555.1 carboxypeptidase-like regulatory domain-containing protein [Pontibacter diazotrophicus]
MHKLLSVLVLLLLLFCSLPVLGQHVVQGRVVDERTDEPLEFVSVYVNTTTIGTSTNEAGAFTLTLPDGHYELIVSYLGYEPIIYPVNTAALPKSILFKVRAKENALQEVVVKGTRDSQWYDNLEVFKQRFLGQSEFGKQCKLLNPEILTITFNAETALLEVKADEPLQIQNDALGYKIEYLLTGFRFYGREGYVVFLGYPKYVLLQGGKRKQRRWERNRQRAYHGSVMHFVRAVQQKRLEEEGFNLRRLYRTPNPDRPTEEEIAAARAALKARSGAVQVGGTDSISDILARARLPKTIESLDINPVPYSDYLQQHATGAKLAFDGYFQVVYTGEKEEAGYVWQQSMFKKREPSYQTSVLYLQSDEVLLESNGNIVEPLNVFFEGYWGWEKVGDMLPLDYQPAEEMN